VTFSIAVAPCGPGAHAAPPCRARPKPARQPK